MMELTTSGDYLNRKSFTLDKMTDDRKTHWVMEIQSGNFPAPFENCNPADRRINLDVVSGKDLNIESRDNSFVLPLVCTGMSRIDGKTIAYYTSRYESKTDKLLSAQISLSTTLEEGQSQPVDDPYVIMTFDVARDKAGSGIETNNQGLGLEPKQPFVHSTVNENSMGGVDIPLDQMDHRLQPGDKVVMPT
jgi:hypothetical protein